MDDRHRAVILYFLNCVIAAGYTLDVCDTCHANAKCEGKPDGSGKVCNCKYGYVGNGRTFCEDKDECQIGANLICGRHARCHNTVGSYYCTCLEGYSPSNNMNVFIPNDGTHCVDKDECEIERLCGVGGLCRNLNGSFDCSCQEGYIVQDGTEPFQPDKDQASCREVECGQPAPLGDTVLLSLTRTTYGGVATFLCEDGFVWRRGDNSAQCGADGLWRGPTMVCAEVDCGAPPAFPHTHMLWNQSSRIGTEVLYLCHDGYQNIGESNVSTCSADGQWEGASVLCQEILCGNPPQIEATEQVWNGSSHPGSSILYFCMKGFYSREGHNVSVCSESGQWTTPTLLCQEISCGHPPMLPHTRQAWNGSSTIGSTVTYYCKIGFYHEELINTSSCLANGSWSEINLLCKEMNCGAPPNIPHSVQLWDKGSTVGSQVVYQCVSGYHSVGERNSSVCNDNRQWSEVSIFCQEIDCKEPLFKSNAKALWNGTSHMGSVVHYQCNEGFFTRSKRNYSVCGENGQWEDFELLCEEIQCGPPLTLSHTNFLWHQTTTAGSMVHYECATGFYQEGGNNISTCLASGKWSKVSMQCKAKCGPVPILAHSEVVWQNRSLAIHRCEDGYRSWRGSNVSQCNSAGVWQRATLRCVEIKPPISDIFVSDEKCLSWRAAKYIRDTQIYKVNYTGARDYDRDFLDTGALCLSSKAEQLKICLNLFPATNYSIFVTAVSAAYTATITTNTSLIAPPAPAVYYTEFETRTPTLRLCRSPNTMDPISLYQVFVVPVDYVMAFDCSSTNNQHSWSQGKAGYITAQMLVRQVGTKINFTVGDGLHYGGFYNAPLESGRNYFIILRAVSQWKKNITMSCVLWAEVRGISYIMLVSSLSAAGVVALAALAGGYCCWLFKRT